MTRAPGFTLIEVMIAASITAAIGVMVAGSFQRAASARDLAESQDQRTTGARLALTRMARELTAAYLSEHFDQKRYRDRLTLFRGKDYGDRDELLFATFTHARLLRDVKESDQAVVEYALDADPGNPGEQALWRREKSRIDDDPERGGTRAIVLEHVKGFDAQYWDWKRQEWVREWNSASTTEHGGFLPTRVKLRVILSMPDGRTRPFETQARIAMVRPLDLR
jgi:general secretion pathway protein J